LYDEIAFLTDQNGFGLSYIDVMEMEHIDRVIMIDRLNITYKSQDAAANKAMRKIKGNKK
jgi:hypothetical protein